MKNIPPLLLLFVVGLTIIGMLFFKDNSLAWLLADIYNIIATTFVAVSLLKNAASDSLITTLAILLFTAALSILLGHILISAAFWLFVNVFVISVGSLAVLKLLFANK